jgi:hypothetical protein
MRYLHHVVAELVAVLAVQVRLRNSRMANSYGLWREAPRGGELLHSTFPTPCSSQETAATGSNRCAARRRSACAPATTGSLRIDCRLQHHVFAGAHCAPTVGYTCRVSGRGCEVLPPMLPLCLAWAWQLEACCSLLLSL